MASHRKIIYSAMCDASAARLGGYEKIDVALDGVIDALSRDPHGFRLVASDWFFSFRYAVTKPVGDVPALVWIFRIEREAVVIEDVEEFEGY
jgi:hypothetical protein